VTKAVVNAAFESGVARKAPAGEEIEAEERPQARL
jgi:hypothetical protein